MMRVIVAGGREFTDRELLYRTLDKAFGAVLNKIVVISGHARGADKLGEEWAKERQVELVTRAADWDKLGKAAGPIRNEEMITQDKATHCVVFWDGISTGSRHMWETALKHGLWVQVIRYAK